MRRKNESLSSFFKRLVAERDEDYKEKQKAKWKEDYSKNKDKRKQYYKDNSEKIKEQSLEYYYNHKDEISSKYYNDCEKHLKVKNYNNKYYLFKKKIPNREECSDDKNNKPKIDTSSYFVVKITEGKFIIEY